MPENVAQKLIRSHLESGEFAPGNELGLRIDQTLTQDATGTLVMLELEALGLDRIRTDLSVQYVDHNLLQTDEKNPEDHEFLQSAAQRFGLWFSAAGNGVSHPVHQSRFGKPGATLIGSDSHTCAAGALGMLAIGVGGLEIAMAMAGEPLDIAAPQVMGVELTGEMPDWVSAKDVILEMLRRHGVKGGVGKIIEYHGEGLKHLTAMDRHVIANMGAELGATATVFPADDAVRDYLEASDRGEDFTRIVADAGAEYDLTDSIDLSQLEPLIAAPSSPGNVTPVRRGRRRGGVPGRRRLLGQSRAARLRRGGRDSERTPDPPADLTRHQPFLPRGPRRPLSGCVWGRGSEVGCVMSLRWSGVPQSRPRIPLATLPPLLPHLRRLADIAGGSGARIHQSGCMGCIGMGQAPAVGRNSLRTMPRNFPGRSGTDEDSVWLCSPETAAAAALTGRITDPRDLDMDYPKVRLPEKFSANRKMLMPPLEPEGGAESRTGQG